MLKFPSIDSFRHAVASIKRAYEYHRLPLPKLTYEGRVKLHGTNAGIHFDLKEKTLTAQSRERVLSLESDNAGFARWVHENAAALLMEFAHLGENAGEDQAFTVYGEWIGPSIQKNVALNQLSEKQFVVFTIAYDDEIVEHEDGSTDCVFYPVNDINRNDDVPGLRYICEVKPIVLEIDFNQPDSAVEQLEKLTQQYEDECPWGKLHGIEGIGEGLVWSPYNAIALDAVVPLDKQHRAWFKTKGEKHGNKGTNNKVKVAVTADKIEDFNALCAQILPDWRLEQGWSKLKETGEPTRKETGDFLKWVVSDVYKEELDTVEASEFEWQVVAGELSKRARQWYLGRT